MDKRKALPKGIRCFLLLLQHVLVVLVASFTVIVISNVVVIDVQDNHTRGYCFNLLESEKDFKDTEVFFDLFYSQLSELVPEVVIGSQIGEDGSFDANHIVNISDYANRKDSGYLGRANGPEYKLSDLLKWYNSGLLFETVSFDSIEKLEDYFGIMIVNTDPVSLAGIQTSFTELLGAPCYFWSDGDSIHVDISVLRENFLPTDGISIRERATSIIEYGELIHELQQSINDLGINVQTYNSNKGTFSMANSNMRYYFVLLDENGVEKVYSNLTEFGESAESYFKNLDAYVVYNTESLDFKSNIQNFRSIHLKNELDAYSYVFDNAICAYIGVDGNFSANDIFAKAYNSYQTINNVWYYIGFASIAALIWLFLLIF